MKGVKYFKRGYLSVVLLTVLAVLTALAGCGGGGGGGETPTTTTSGSLKLKALDIGKTVSLTKAYEDSVARYATGDTGSSMEGFLVKVEKLELKKSDGTYVTVYSGNEYLETVGTGAGTFAGVVSGIMPNDGTYTGVKLTSSATDSFKVKVKIVSGTTTYFTTKTTAAKGVPWSFSTSSANYDYITATPTSSPILEMDFPTPLTVTSNNNVDIIWELERNGIVSFDGSLPNSVTWAAEEDIVRAILPKVPSKRIQFNLTAGSRSNTITLLLDGNGNLLGGFCHRPGSWDIWDINGSFMKGGSLSTVSNSGNTATFDVSFLDGQSNGYYQITGSYNCGTSTSGTYSSLAVTGIGVTPYYISSGSTLTTTGSVTCGNIAG